MAAKARTRTRPTTNSLPGWNRSAPARPKPGNSSQIGSAIQSASANPNNCGTRAGSCTSQTAAAPATHSKTIHATCANGHDSPASRALSQPPATSRIAASTTLNHSGGSNSNAEKTSVASTMDVMTRDLSMPQRRRVGESSEATLPTRKIGQRGVEIVLGEVRPQYVAEIQFGIRQVPQQVVREPALAAGPNEQVRLGLPVQLHRVGKPRFVDVVRRQRAGLHPAGQRPRAVDDIAATTVAGGDVELQSGVVPGDFLGAGHAALERCRKRLAPADETQAHRVLVEFLDLAIQRPPEQAHQALHFVPRPAPVFARESIDRQIRYAAFADRAHDPP